jgi:hypothetical protein
MKLSNWIKYILLTGVIILFGYGFILFQYGSIHVKGTLNTKYHKIENSTDKIIETYFFKIRAPNNWIHFFGGYGTEGDPYGAFYTNKGIIHYEYGSWGPDYNEDDDIYGYTVEKDIINRFKISIARNENGETGICIPTQNEMKASMTFYLDKSISNNFEDIIKGINELEFK